MTKIDLEIEGQSSKRICFLHLSTCYTYQMWKLFVKYSLNLLHLKANLFSSDKILHCKPPGIGK